MCLGCTLSYITGDDHFPADRFDEIVWPEVTDEMKLLARLRWVLYECTSAITGGPMHIFTDDYNVEDNMLDSCETSANDRNFWKYAETTATDAALIKAVSNRIIDLARPMSEVERAVALSLSWGELRLDMNGKVVR